MSEEPALRLVNTDSGEVVENCLSCFALMDEIAGLERDIRGWRARYADLKRDKDADARKDPLWPGAMALFAEWKLKTGHPRCKWGTDRFELVKPFMENYGIPMCRRALAGAAYDPWFSKRRQRNGHHYCGNWWEDIFRSSKTFENYANKAPMDWTDG